MERRRLSIPGKLTARAVLVVLVFLPSLLPVPVFAQFQGRTEQGQISVAHVADLIARAGNDAMARERLSFYLTSVGESAGYFLMHAKGHGISLSCASSMSVGSDTAWAAISAHAPDSTRWAATAATPIILDDLLARSGC